MNLNIKVWIYTSDKKLFKTVDFNKIEQIKDTKLGFDIYYKNGELELYPHKHFYFNVIGIN